jgi:hypothetical protein
MPPLKSSSVPPKYVEYTSPVPLAFRLLTNTLLAPKRACGAVRWKAPTVMGKSTESVLPVRYTLPAASSATPVAMSDWLLPPSRVA